MRSVATIEKELADWRVISRVAVRQMLDGNGSPRAINMAHKNACDRITELQLELKRARKRRRK